MFQEIYDICKSVDLVLSISAPVHGKLVISVMPKKKTDEGEADKNAEALNLKPLVVSGTPEEMDAGFLTELRKAGKTVTGLVSNLAKYQEMATQEHENAKQRGTATAKKVAARPAASSKPKDDAQGSLFT